MALGAPYHPNSMRQLSQTFQVGVLCAAVWVAGSGCKKDPPAATPPATTPPPSTSSASSGGTEGTATDGSNAGGEAQPGDNKLEKSEELRFIETNAALMCFEREKKKAPSPKERAEILKAHGFAGKLPEQRFNDFSIRGEKDREWGRRTAERIKAETASVCPSEK